MDIVGQAQELHGKWKSHNGFKNSGLKVGFRRDAKGNIVEVPDGVIFPILASLSVFAEKTNSGWRINPPQEFQDADLISSAKRAFIEIAKSNPQTMGKTRACYTQLEEITALFKRLSN